MLEGAVDRFGLAILEQVLYGAEAPTTISAYLSIVPHNISRGRVYLVDRLRLAAPRVSTLIFSTLCEAL